MIGRALDAGLPAAWVTADEFYGTNQANRVTPPAAPSSDKSRPAWQRLIVSGSADAFMKLATPCTILSLVGGHREFVLHS
jgi:hypothetical protein